MWYDTAALIDYMYAGECRRFELYLQFPKLRYLFDEIESDSIVIQKVRASKTRAWVAANVKCTEIKSSKELENDNRWL